MNTLSSNSKKYRNYVLGMLTLVYIFNFIDRQLLVILQESIKAELDLSDTQLGLLTGFTFAIFYATLGMPIARMADRWNRRNIVAASLTIWSAMTALSGSVQNFVQLLLARIGVGIGEAINPDAPATAKNISLPLKPTWSLDRENSRVLSPPDNSELKNKIYGITNGILECFEMSARGKILWQRFVSPNFTNVKFYKNKI